MSGTITHSTASKEDLLAELRERDTIHAQLVAYGFRANTSVIRGLRPHYRRGDDLLFIATPTTFIGRVVRIAHAYEHQPGKVFMLVPEQARSLLCGDLIASKKVIPLKLAPVRTAQWGNEEIEWVPYSL